MTSIQLSLWASKVCLRCQVDKSVSEFHRSAQNKDGLQSYCRVCRKSISAEWLQKNKESHREYVKAYRQSHPGMAADSAKKYRLARLDHFKEYNARRRKNNKRMYSEYARIRLHRKRGNGGSYTSKEWDNLCERFNNQCLCCGETAKLTVDHVIPVSKGGTSNIDNLQPLCRSCNRRKGVQIIDYRAT